MTKVKLATLSLLIFATNFLWSDPIEDLITTAVELKGHYHSNQLTPQEWLYQFYDQIKLVNKTILHKPDNLAERDAQAIIVELLPKGDPNKALALLQPLIIQALEAKSLASHPVSAEGVDCCVCFQEIEFENEGAYKDYFNCTGQNHNDKICLTCITAIQGNCPICRAERRT